VKIIDVFIYQKLRRSLPIPSQGKDYISETVWGLDTFCASQKSDEIAEPRPA